MAFLLVIEDLGQVIDRGGHAMHVLQWLQGLRRCGHDVLFLEFLEPPEDDALVEICTNDAKRYFQDVIQQWWSLERASLLPLEPGEALLGVPADRVAELADRADAVLTLGAHYRPDLPALVAAVRPRILVDQDPGYTQIWASYDDPVDIFAEHDVYFTVGGNIGSTRCRVPTLGVEWNPIHNPVIEEWWANDGRTADDRFTTIAAYRDFGYLEFEGEVLGTKAEEYQRFLELPELVGEPLELALYTQEDEPDLKGLREHGWKIVRPAIAATPGAYRDYIIGSAGEFACAKGGYVGTRCGWFSDRSGCYLAAGRPVVLQATGFEDLLPTGEGLFAVRDVAEAAAALRAIRSDYARHSRAARAIARDFLSHERIVPRVLTAAGVC